MGNRWGATNQGDTLAHTYYQGLTSWKIIFKDVALQFTEPGIQSYEQVIFITSTISVNRPRGMSEQLKQYRGAVQVRQLESCRPYLLLTQQVNTLEQWMVNGQGSRLPRRTAADNGQVDEVLWFSLQVSEVSDWHWHMFKKEKLWENSNITKKQAAI